MTCSLVSSRGGLREAEGTVRCSSELQEKHQGGGIPAFCSYFQPDTCFLQQISAGWK